jgi:uncharacterized protein
MIIGFDLDDVLLNFQDTMRVYHNETYDTNHTLEEDCKVWNLWERWSCTPEESKQRVFDFYNHQSHYDAKPIVGSVDGISALKNDHTLHIITARPEQIKEKTFEWLDTYFPNVFEKVIFTNLFYGEGVKRKKSDVCKELGVEVFIEDAFHNAHDVANAGIPVLLLDQPWNQNHTDLPPLVTRVHSWPEIVEKLNLQ